MSANEKKFSANLAAVKSRFPARLTGSAMFSAQAWEKIARTLNLSGRELQIVRGAFDDQKELTLAGDLGMSSHTVHTHIERLHRKLAITDRTQLVLRVTQEFLALTASPAHGLPPICSNRAAGRCPLNRCRRLSLAPLGR
jgi:DNA-binding NarL/FixJ family response regulator